MTVRASVHKRKGLCSNESILKVGEELPEVVSVSQDVLGEWEFTG